MATRDFLAAVDSITTDSRRAASKFTDEVEDALIRIGRHPRIGAERRELADPPVRFWTLQRHPYILIYDAAVTPPSILRILHGSRDLPELLSDLRS
ncbi:MAG: type II toxin-antitoxin system RelE/ParE family toxin [Caulobacterales bacterium]|nr:type II toxin-antitoxin system RelE/ParE family toxin [Caulobacterales bacterium]